MPPTELLEPELLQGYLSAQSETWAIVHGLRYLALPCLALFAAAMFVRTCCLKQSSATGWGVFGLLGAAMLVINAFITNGIEGFVLLDAEPLRDEPAQFLALFRAIRFLFTAEIVTWAVFLLGFSIAGWCSRTLPVWIAGVGIVSAVAGFLSGVFIVSVFEDGKAVVLIDVASMTGLLWFASSAIYLILRGASVAGDPVESALLHS